MGQFRWRYSNWTPLYLLHDNDYNACTAPTYISSFSSQMTRIFGHVTHGSFGGGNGQREKKAIKTKVGEFFNLLKRGRVRTHVPCRPFKHTLCAGVKLTTLEKYSPYWLASGHACTCPQAKNWKVAKWSKPFIRRFNGMGNDPFVDFPGEWALLALEYTQPLQSWLYQGWLKEWRKKILIIL